MSMDLRARLWKAYWPVERLLVPGLKHAQTVYEDVLREHLDATTKWLDLGCGRNVLPSWRRDAEASLLLRCAFLVGLDRERESLRENLAVTFRCQASISDLPFADNSFDLITANMVMEHLEQPSQQLREISRVLRPGGKLIFHTPNAAGHVTVLARLLPGALKRPLAFLIDGRESKDVFPTFYRANSDRAIRRLAEGAHLRVKEIKFISSTASMAVIPPLALLELLWLRTLRLERCAFLRSNLVVILTKPR